MLIKKLIRRFMKPLDDDAGGDTGGAGESDAISSMADTISNDLFGGSSNEDDGNGGNLDADPSLDPAKPVPNAGTPDNLDPPKPGTGEPEKPAGNPDPAATPPAGGKVEAPKTWRPEAKASWDALPSVAQQEILKREADIFAGLNQYKDRAEIGNTFVNAVQPHLNLLRQQGHDPAVLATQMFQVHATLSSGTPEQRMTALREIAEASGIDLSSLAPADPENAPYVDPEVKRLQQQLAAVQSQQSKTAEEQQRVRAAEESRVRANLAAEIDAFEADPANIYFKDVAHIIPGLLSSGQAKTLKDAYEQATWLNPVTREKEVARKTAETAAAAREAARLKAKQAQSAAAANVRSSAKQASGTALLGSIDDTLKETFAQINARNK